MPLEENLKGSYLLVSNLSDPSDIEVGALGRLHFSRGIYVYAGSALNGLNARLKRHFSQQKTLWWHIDYLLVHAEALEALVLPSEKRLECSLNQMVASLEGSEEVKGFGVSDCRCSTHLHRVDEDSLRCLMHSFRDELRVRPR